MKLLGGEYLISISYLNNQLSKPIDKP